ncbi:MAG: hypothetical protein Q4E76_02405 [Tissierellia bacterium]|nr:hypothetical protein [Tissierellia bacterium]
MKGIPGKNANKQPLKELPLLLPQYPRPKTEAQFRRSLRKKCPKAQAPQKMRGHFGGEKVKKQAFEELQFPSIFHGRKIFSLPIPGNSSTFVEISSTGDGNFPHEEGSFGVNIHNKKLHSEEWSFSM